MLVLRTRRLQNCKAFGPMGLQSRKSPAEGEFLFELDEQPLEETMTAMGGVPLFVRAARSLDVPGSVKRNVNVKERAIATRMSASPGRFWTTTGSPKSL